MNTQKYDTDQLHFSVQEVTVPGGPSYQLVVRYDCEWIFNWMFDSENEVKEFLDKYYELFTYKAEVVRAKIYAYKALLC